MGDAEVPGDFGGTAVEAEGGASAGFAAHLELEPVYPSTYAGPEGFGAGFLCRETRGEAFGSVVPAHAIRLLGGGKYSV